MTSAWRFLIRYDNNDASELDLAWPQDPAPALEVPEPGWACLTPASAGNYRVALRVTNSCGATGGPAEVSMQVGP
jgi:hypothetical protein